MYQTGNLSHLQLIWSINASFGNVLCPLQNRQRGFGSIQKNVVLVVASFLQALLIIEQTIEKSE